MIETTVAALLPLFFVMGLGYFAGHTKRLDAHQTSGINRVLVEFALPAALFTGTAQTPRAELLEYAPLLGALLIAFGAVWLIGNALARVFFHRDAGTASLQATMLAFPNTGFMGVPIVGGLFGASGVVLVAMATVLGTLLFIPLTVIVLEWTHHQHTSPSPSNLRAVILPAFLNTAKLPLVWAPLLAAILVLGGIVMPTALVTMLNLMGSVTAGLAMFAAGLTLAAYPVHLNFEIGVNTILKMIGQPLLMLLLVLGFGISGLRAHEGVIVCALPTGILATILASRYHKYQAEASSTLVLTSLCLMVMLPVWRIVLG